MGSACSSNKKLILTYSTIIIFIILYFGLLGCLGAQLRRPPPALLVFGDSVVDTGNNDFYITIANGKFLPYGIDFEGGKPTGRFSNGKLPSDLFAQALGIKELLPPYLDPSLQIQDLTTGVSFASAGAGYDPLTSEIEFALGLTEQMNMFKEYIERLKAAVGERRTSMIISESVYLNCAGTNDITNTYYLLQLRRNYTISSYIDLLMGFASSFYQELYKLGARKIVVLGAPPAGCLPSQRTLAGGLLRYCVDQYNQDAILFNTKLQALVDSLNTELPSFKLLYNDIYAPFMEALDNPSKYGFKETEKGCCGTGEIEVSFFCQHVHVCENRNIYVFFDSFHPTEAMYKYLINSELDKLIDALGLGF